MGTRKFAGRSADGTDCQSRCANGGGGLPGVQGHRQQRPQRSTRTIGKIDDLLVTRDGKEPYAVLSIGGFLGMGARMVVVRYDSLRFDPDNKIVLPGGTKDGLMMLPAFEYAKQ